MWKQRESPKPPFARITSSGLHPNWHRLWSTGVMEYWSVEKKDINPFVITPILQYSNSTKLVEIESHDDGLPSLGL
jgi:hypothetical protein